MDALDLAAGSTPRGRSWLVVATETWSLSRSRPVRAWSFPKVRINRRREAAWARVSTDRSPSRRRHAGIVRLAPASGVHPFARRYESRRRGDLRLGWTGRRRTARNQAPLPCTPIAVAPDGGCASLDRLAGQYVWDFFEAQRRLRHRMACRHHNAKALAVTPDGSCLSPSRTGGCYKRMTETSSGGSRVGRELAPTPRLARVASAACFAARIFALAAHPRNQTRPLASPADGQRAIQRASVGDGPASGISAPAQRCALCTPGTQERGPPRPLPGHTRPAAPKRGTTPHHSSSGIWTMRAPDRRARGANRTTALAVNSRPPPRTLGW